MQITPSHQMLQALGSGPARPEPVREAKDLIAVEAVRQVSAAESVPLDRADGRREGPGPPGSRVNIIV